MSENLRNSEVEDLSWYHPNADRHIAESLLMQNAQDGSYLMRPSSKQGEFALSIRCKEAVKHYNIYWDGKHYKFGMAIFDNLQEFTEHFVNRPLVAGESGILTVLKFPYPRHVEEPGHYDHVKIHAEFGRLKTQDDSPHLAIGSKSGYLTKQGGKIKQTWKTRWFVLVKNELKYYRDQSASEPIRVLDLAECQECTPETCGDKDNCFRLIFPWRTFHLYAATDEETNDWIKLIQWKLKRLAQDGMDVR
ncbi:hypothetical protein LSH36_249g03018 [Paralvinella palmiformis]|uniref:Dual adapter for phosphotyrosine and 3-phosphotyrosine and 3-phosphoinositide n=1 Tax=Paralvinella palmiformis TaxID=53620 RepID=A0AAD9JLX2_9ANNE|nr:hypothetical protein LSH36_249g03018 [Paralvinella palmiformis]